MNAYEQVAASFQKNVIGKNFFFCVSFSDEMIFNYLWIMTNYSFNAQHGDTHFVRLDTNWCSRNVRKKFMETCNWTLIRIALTYLVRDEKSLIHTHFVNDIIIASFMSYFNGRSGCRGCCWARRMTAKWNRARRERFHQTVYENKDDYAGDTSSQKRREINFPWDTADVWVCDQTVSDQK